jgi:TPR repeat protein
MIGSAYMSGNGVDKDENKGFEWCSRSAEDGYLKSHYILAESYAKGRGVKRDLDKAFELHSYLGEKGYGKSQLYVGTCYLEGKNVKANEKKAFEWFTKGAENSNPVCQYFLGYCYANGLGTKQDEQKALVWYTRAAEQGHTVSKKLVEDYTGNKVVVKGEASPFESYRFSAENGDPEAMFILARYYEDGIGVEKDMNEAKKWYNKAAASGHFGAKKAMMRFRSAKTH